MIAIYTLVGGALFVYTAPTEAQDIAHKGTWISLWWKQVVIACVTLACMCATKC